jgi:hypothetical protein
MVLPFLYKGEHYNFSLGFLPCFYFWQRYHSVGYLHAKKKVPHAGQAVIAWLLEL